MDLFCTGLVGVYTGSHLSCPSILTYVPANDAIRAVVLVPNYLSRFDGGEPDADVPTLLRRNCPHVSLMRLAVASRKPSDRLLLTFGFFPYYCRVELNNWFLFRFGVWPILVFMASFVITLLVSTPIIVV